MYKRDKQTQRRGTKHVIRAAFGRVEVNLIHVENRPQSVFLKSRFQSDDKCNTKTHTILSGRLQGPISATIREVEDSSRHRVHLMKYDGPTRNACQSGYLNFICIV